MYTSISYWGEIRKNNLFISISTLFLDQAPLQTCIKRSSHDINDKGRSRQGESILILKLDVITTIKIKGFQIIKCKWNKRFRTSFTSYMTRYCMYSKCPYLRQRPNFSRCKGFSFASHKDSISILLFYTSIFLDYHGS